LIVEGAPAHRVGRSPYFASDLPRWTHVTRTEHVDRAAAGEEALRRCDWAAAQAAFEAVLADDPDDPRALDGLAMAVFWLGDLEAPRGLRERAYVEHRRRGDTRRAAAAAVFVSGEYRIAGDNAAAARGWLARAERCLDGVPPCSERGAIELERAKTADDLDDAERHARRALELARELADPDLEITALAQLGVQRVSSGRWEEGMALLDEAMAAAMGGEASDALAICDTCCQTLVACDQIADLRRASEWCRVVVEFTERRRFTPVRAWCRAIFAGVLTATGDWERAERELLESLRIYRTDGGIGSRVMTLARLADLRLRQGRLEEAERLLADCEEHPHAVVPVARLRVARGDAGAAAAMLERRLATLPNDAPARAPLLPAFVDVLLARGDVDGAAVAAASFAELAARLCRENLLALAQLARADVALARGAHALDDLEAALELFLRLGMPFEASEVRLRLARVFTAGRTELAVDEAQFALATFEHLGAARKADEAAALLRSLGRPGRTAPRGSDELTRREREVLALLGEGLSNAEIAGRLVISPKTAGHHVERIFRKLGLRNRGEAAAYVLREAMRADR
jgi:ATP/maltotriose-dependent transcriptional regulator MalT